MVEGIVFDANFWDITLTVAGAVITLVAALFGLGTL